MRERPAGDPSAGADLGERHLSRSARGVAVTAQGWSWTHAERERPAVAGLDLQIAPGEKVLLAGPSGAGKSTLLHALGAVLHDDEAEVHGRLLLDGVDPEQARGRSGLMQQDPESQVVLSRIGDDVAFAAENLAVPREQIWRRVREALADVGLQGFDLDHPTAKLSGGQKQRLALAGILAMRPGLLLLDEPTANLDPEGVWQVRDAVLAAAEATGATVILVEHRLEVWAEHMDTLLVLEPGGGIRRCSPAAEVFTDAGLRQELAGMGLWVPGLDPLRELPAWPGSAEPEDGEDWPGGDEPLLLAQGLGVGRHSPSPGWRRAQPRPATVQDLDLVVRRGQTLGITGANGAGKSTLLLTLAGLLPAHAGSLSATAELKRGTGLTPGDELKGGAELEAGTLLADDPHDWRSADLVARIGVVFQEPEHQFVRSTVREELALGAQQAKTPGTTVPVFTEQEVQDRVARLLQRLGLTELAEANPFTLSGGEKRRLSVGTVLSAGPEVLMLDEPTFGQDARTFAELIALLRDHVDAGGTVLAVTHDSAFLQGLRAEQLQIPRPAPDAQRAMPAEEDHAAPPDRSQRGHRSEDPGTELFGAARSLSWLGRRNALAKLIAVLLITAALVMTIDVVSSGVVILACLALLPLAGIRPGGFLRRIWPFAAGSVVAAWGTAIAAEESGRVVADLGFTTISEGSITLGLALGARAFAIVLPSVIVFSTTDPTDLADSLAQQLRLPARFVLGALAAMRLLGLLAEHWRTIGHARRARGVGTQGGFGARMRATASQAFGLLVQAIRMATRLAVTMESRGFGAGPRSWARPARFSPADLPVVLGGAAIGAAAVAAAILTGAWNFVWT